MATNRHAIIRYRAIDKCLRNSGRKYTFNDLHDAVNDALLDIDPSSDGIQIRQLRDDIRFMKSEAGYNAPIITFNEGRVFYYKYEDKDFSINNTPINTTEAEQLRAAIGILQRFEGVAELEWLNEIGPMISNQFKLDNTDKKVIAYDNNIDYKGYDKITPIFNAIINKRVLEVEYEPFNKPKFTLRFHPYFLKEYTNRWFVIGLNEKLGIETWNLALDRIQVIKEVQGVYKETNIDWEDYFYDVIGVTVPENRKTELIELLFTEEQANYIETKPLHPSQKANRLDSGELLVRLNIIPNYELETRLLSFGENVKVLKPEKLKDSLLQRLNRATQMYKD